MANSEQQLAFFKTSVNGSACNLCITNKRFIVIGKKSGFFSNSETKGFLLGGFIGAAIGNEIDKHKRENNAAFSNSTGLPEIQVIDDLINYDPKNNFAITFDSLNWVALNIGSTNMTMISKKGWFQFKFNKAQTDNLSKLLPTLTLSEKFKINK
jgi:hypothetical protein